VKIKIKDTGVFIKSTTDDDDDDDDEVFISAQP
jgi:hypothetical protein